MTVNHAVKPVKIIEHSINPSNSELITYQLRYWRAIHGEVLTHRQFCLDGDCYLTFDLPTKQAGNFKSYKMKLKDFVEKWHNGVVEHKASRFIERNIDLIKDDVVYSAKQIAEKLGYECASNIRDACRQKLCKVINPDKKRTDDFLIIGSDFKEYYESLGTRSFSIQGRLKNMFIRQLNEKTGMIQNSRVIDCQISGKKEVFEVSAGKYKVAGSKDHRILTSTGWKKISELVVGEDEIIVQKLGKVESDRKDPIRLKKINGVWRSRWQLSIYDTLLTKQNSCCLDCSKSDCDFEVHHEVAVYKDPTKAFDESNVVLLCKDCHKQRHKKQGWQTQNYLYGLPVKVTEIISIGEKNTYDLSIEGEFENFLANGVVVHNSRNASSSRAIPVNKIFWQVMKDPAGPILFGKNKKGMQSTEYYGEFMQGLLRFVWNNTGRMVALISKGLEWVGVHKQFANRLTEPWQFISVLVTATEYENWYKLRNHKDAQPEIQCLAREMLKALGESIPTLLNQGGWHLPYIYPYERTLYNIGDLVKMSTARCARVSYGNFDGKGTTIDADLKLYYQLVESKPEHASPTEHQAVVEAPMNRNWQSNFDNTWVQHRKFIENNVAVE